MGVLFKIHLGSLLALLNYGV